MESKILGCHHVVFYKKWKLSIVKVIIKVGFLILPHYL